MTTDTGANGPTSDTPETPADPIPAQPVLPDVSHQSRKRRRARMLVIAASLTVLVAVGTGLALTDPLALVRGTERTMAFDEADPSEAHRERVKAMLDERATALLAGNEEGWLEAIEPSEEELVADQRRSFRLLRQMGVGLYEYELVGTNGTPGGSLPMSATVVVRYCFGNADCRPGEHAVVLSLGGPDDAVVTRYRPAGDIRPWEVSALRVAAGERVVIAAQPRFAGRLARFRREADRAAAYAERFGPQDGTLGKHVIFLGASGTEADRWYRGNLSDAGRGLSHTVSSHRLSLHQETHIASVEHSLKAPQVGNDEVRETVAWQVGFGAASAGTEDHRILHEGLRVGIAWYVADPRADPRDYRLADDLKPVLRHWKGDLSEIAPPDGDIGSDSWDAASWAAVHRLIDRYGEKEFIAFFNAVARDGKEYEVAASKHLGRGLKEVESDVLRYLRSLG